MYDFDDISGILGSYVNNLDIKSKLSDARIFNHWKEIVGSEISLHAKPKKLKEGILHISAVNPIWAGELSAMSCDLIIKINKFLGYESVKKINVRADLKTAENILKK